MASLESATSGASFCFDGKWKICKEEQPSSRSCGRAISGRRFPAPSMKRTLSSAGSRRCSFTRKCSMLVREQRARFYIMRRCVTMLICWRDYGDC
ncbi:hypothetical protein SAY86_030946 [Trapa natans]|uniref:ROTUNDIFOLIA like 8 n=1 Tax=Trapa natans TaxID=22666 RepID=A0AAN7RE11_TRANT|nr:hypothetical protein SAY86_030946 [Trapa natans]